MDIGGFRVAMKSEDETVRWSLTDEETAVNGGRDAVSSQHIDSPTVILSEAKDLKMRTVSQRRSFSVFAPQDDG